MPGIGQGQAVTQGLSRVGITADAFIWRWHPGLQGGVFEPHRDMNGRTEATPDDFPVLPRQDVNYRYCMCVLAIRWRDSRGRFTRPTQPTSQPVP